MKERILNILKDKERSIHELQHVLDLNNSEGFTVLLKALNQLEDEGKIVRNDKNEYLLIENSNYILGVLHINKRGFGFVIIDEEKKLPLFASQSANPVGRENILSLFKNYEKFYSTCCL